MLHFLPKSESEGGRNLKLARNIEDPSLNMWEKICVGISFHDVTVSVMACSDRWELWGKPFCDVRKFSSTTPHDALMILLPFSNWLLTDLVKVLTREKVLLRINLQIFQISVKVLLVCTNYKQYISCSFHDQQTQNRMFHAKQMVAVILLVWYTPLMKKNF